MQNVDRWHQTQRIRAYVTAYKNAVDSGQLRLANEQQFEKWFDWASRLANSIDPILATPLPEGTPTTRQNTSVTDLNLTAAARVAINKLAVADTDALWQQKQSHIREACAGKFGPVWNEITRFWKRFIMT